MVDRLAYREVFCQYVFVITLGIPARLPVFDDAEPEPYGMHFLSQKCPPSTHSNNAAALPECQVAFLVADISRIIGDNHRHMAKAALNTRHPPMRPGLHTLDPERVIRHNIENIQVVRVEIIVIL